MSGFPAEWLDLREAADARARRRDLAEAAAAGRAAAGNDPEPYRIVDLGGGTGANLRWLATILGGRQHWTCVDNDPALLAALPARLRGWARSQRLDLAVADSASTAMPAIDVRGPSLELTVERAQIDLHAGLDALALPPGGLVTASALLDLVSADWIERLGDRISAAGASALFALSYDGRLALEPAAPEDEALRALVNRHQRGNKGFGPALGPTATDVTAAALAVRGYRVERATSDWQIATAESGLQRALIAGWASAAREVSPADSAWIGDWLDRRNAQIAAASLRVVVGHEDLFARPAS